MQLITRSPRLARLDFLPVRILDLIDPDPDSDHLLWTGGTTLQGYPRVWNDGALVMLSRWIATEVHGPPPTPQHQAGHICHDERSHECHSTLVEFDFHRLCTNPDHIAWQTAAENIMANPRSQARINRDRAVRRVEAQRQTYLVWLVTPWWVWMSDEDREIYETYSRELSIDERMLAADAC